MKKYLPLAFLFLAACAPNWPNDGGATYMGQPVSCPQDLETIYEEVEILSEPPGANIEVDNAYVGKTPLKYTTARKHSVTALCRHYLEGVRIVANPTQGGHCQQVKRIVGMSRMPEKIFFTMALCPVPSVNIQVE